MATYNVHGGHSLNCRGASGLLDEVNEDRKVKNKVIELLRAKGHTVYDCTDDGGTTPIKNLKNIVSKCNVHKVDLDVSIHLNAGGGHGCEVYGYSDKMSGVGARVSANIASALGITNRGFKVRTNLYVLHRTNSPAILIECCFVDSATDKARWNVDKCAHAIADAIIGNRAASAPQPKHQQGAVTHIAYSQRVKDYQRAYNASYGGNLAEDGKKGPKTEATFDRIIIKDLASGYDSHRTMVKFIQSVVGVKADGLFGSDTKAAVIRYQKLHDLADDGVVGKKTIAAMVS